MEIEKVEKKEIDKKLIEVLEDSEKARIEAYKEALKRLVSENKKFADCISEDDIKKLAMYKDEEISKRDEIKALKKVRQKMLDEEKQTLSEDLSKRVGKGMENSIEYGNATIKAVLLGIFGGPVGITLMACKELISAQQTKEQLKRAILDSVENGSETEVHNLIAQKDRDYGKILNFSGFMDFIKKSDVFHDLLENESEKKKIIDSLETASKEAFKEYSELEEYKDKKLMEKENEKFQEDEEDPEPEIGMKLMI